MKCEESAEALCLKRVDASTDQLIKPSLQILLSTKLLREGLPSPTPPCGPGPKVPNFSESQCGHHQVLQTLPSKTNVFYSWVIVFGGTNIEQKL